MLNENRRKLKEAKKTNGEFSKKSKKNKERVYSTVHVLSSGAVDTSHFYVQIMDYKREMAHAVNFIIDPISKHLDNNHKPFNPEQRKELKELVSVVNKFFELALQILENEKFEQIDDLISGREQIFDYLGSIEKNQINRIKNREVNTRNSQLFFKIISETRNLLLHAVNELKSERDFITYTRKNTVAK